MSDTTDNVRNQIEPSIHATTDANQENFDNDGNHLLEELFDEVNDSDAVLNVPDIAETTNEPVMTDEQPGPLHDEHQSPYLLAGIMMMILVAGIGYYVSVADNEPSDTAAQSEQAEQRFHAASHILKPLPVPAMASDKTDNTAVTSTPKNHPSPSVAPIREASPAPVQPPAAQKFPTPEKPRVAVRKNVPADSKSMPLRTATTHSAWAVNLMALSTHDAAIKALQRLTAKGYKPELALVKKAGRVFYRIRIPDLPDRKTAEKTRALFRAMPEYRHAWINHYKK